MIAVMKIFTIIAVVLLHAGPFVTGKQKSRTHVRIYINVQRTVC